MAIGKTKNSTNDIIDSAIQRQNTWQKNRRTFTRQFLKSIDTFAVSNDKPKPQEKAQPVKNVKDNNSGVKAYWFPILCAFIVLVVALWVACVRVAETSKLISKPAVVPVATSNVPEPIVKPVFVNVPTFDVVRIEKNGSLVIAGRWKPNVSVSVYLNDKMVATEKTDEDGEFAYVPANPLKPGNYTLYLVGTMPETKSANKVFLYVSEKGGENSLSLLMTDDGSRLLQMPLTMADGDLVVSKIDYLSDGRLVVTGDALPRLRVSLDLDGKYVGFARVSDYKHFGLGADVGNLKPGQEYVMTVRLHDGEGRTVATVKHQFKMPEMTGDDDTFYTVRRGDCLWIIARNFLRRGVLFSVIAQRNNIANPDLIYPKQILEIPVDAAKRK